MRTSVVVPSFPNAANGTFAEFVLRSYIKMLPIT